MNTIEEFDSVLTGGSIIASPKALQGTPDFPQGPPLLHFWELQLPLNRTRGIIWYDQWEFILYLDHCTIFSI